MKLKFAFLLITLAAIVWGGICQPASGQSVEKLLAEVGIKPQGCQRGQCDIIGFASTAEQMDAVFRQSVQLAELERKLLDERCGWNSETSFIAAVCPHDDYYYAGRLYALSLSRIQARCVILFGVFHKAKAFDCRDKLIFDSYRTWHGPYGPVEVSPLREEILHRLPADDYIVSNDMQMVEHSTEAIVPFLQAFNRDAQIVSILVPFMDWVTLDRLADNLSQVLADICREKGWRLGRDLSLVFSADAVHYGDSGWGGGDYADFGTDVTGYQKAVKRDVELAENHLCGPLDREKLRAFMHSCVDSEDVRKYLITWCGRFSIPLGLNTASRLTETLENRSLAGTLLDYGTSVSEASLDVEGLGSLGQTAPNNFHHWVGYPAIGYK